MTASALPSHAGLPPSALSRFVGRSRELSAVAELSGSTRLLTLTGAGGSGKTRLAAETVTRVAHRWDTIAWVDLAPATDSAQVANKIGAAFGLAEREETAAVAGLEQVLRDRPALLVLDNCEHVINSVAGLADRLLRGAARLSILATSREALGVEGETAWLVPPLVPDEAQELFVERARSVHPSFTVTPDGARGIAEICRRLDGIPLAIELAAARVRVLSIDQIAERLKDALQLLSGGSRTAVARHRTLRSTIEWSVGLLADDERVLLRRIAVFPATFSLEAAEAVVPDDGLAAAAILDTLSGLVEKSLLVLDANEADARYRLLETVRQFAVERLAETSERDWLERRHAEHYLSVAERVAPSIYGGGSAQHLAPLIADSANFRAAVEWAQAPERFEIGLRLVWALHWFWWARGSFDEVQPLKAALGPSLGLSPTVRIRGLVGFAQMDCWQGRFEEAVRHGEAAVALLDGSDDFELLAMAHTMAGFARMLIGDLDGAMAHIDRAVPLGKAHSTTIIAGIALHPRGICLAAQGDLEGAWAAHAEQLAILLAKGFPQGATHALNAQGGVRVLQHRQAEALPLFREALEIAAQVPMGWGIAKGMEGIGICIASRDPEQAAQIFGAAEALRERIAHPMWLDEVGRYRPVVERLQAGLGPQLAAHWNLGRKRPEAEAIAAALDQARRGGSPEVGRSAAPTSAVPTTATKTADLEVRSLGRLDVTRGGVPIEPQAWGSARPRELLVFLLAHPGGVSKERVGAALWPDASPTQLRNNFHVTMHRLRKTLGDGNWVGSANDQYGIDPAVTVEFDAALFEREIKAGLSGLKRDPAVGAALLSSALGRYRGPFLENEQAGDWALDYRDRLNRMFVDGGLAYARWLVDQSRLDDAIATLRSVTARDVVAEEGWTALMMCYARKGDRVQALKLFQQLETLLAAELETTPGPAAVKLRDRIQQGEAV